MRKLVLLTLVLLNVRAFSQVIYSQNFSTLTLTGYTTTNGSGLYALAPSSFITIDDANNNNAGTFSSPNSPFNYSPLKNKGWLVTYNSIENDTFLVSTSWHETATATVSADDWIITEPITITAANSVFRWRARSPDPNYRDGYEVYTSTVTGTPTTADFPIGNRIFVIADNNTAGEGENSTWTNRSVLLGASYVGQTVRFAFRNNSKDRFQLWIDDIQVAAITSVRDIVLNEVDVKKYNKINASDTVWATFTNMGSQPITTLVLNYQYGTSAITTQTFTSTLGWGNMAVAQVSFAQTFNFSSPGIYPLKVWASAINDLSPQATGDDTASANITAVSANVARTVLMEQFVSAYDGESPDLQEKGQGIATASLIPVNMHYADTLEIPDAAPLFYAFKKNGATAMFDRFYFKEIGKVGTSKLNYPDKSSKRIEAVSPASVSIVNKTYNSATRALSFTVRVEFTGEVKGDYRINAYLTEDFVYGNPVDTSVNGYNQLNNYYSVPWSFYYLKGYFSNAYNTHVMSALHFKHLNVLTKAFDGAYGLPGTIPINGGTSGNSYTQTYTLTLPTVTTGIHKWIEDNISIVGFVGEFGTSINERTILNAAKEKLTANPSVIGVEETAVENIVFTMFPNPSAGELYLNLPQNLLNQQISVSVKDMLGKTLRSEKANSAMPVIELNIKGLSDGIYMVELEKNGDKTTQKLIISH
jgi:hypothetical protein